MRLIALLCFFVAGLSWAQSLPGPSNGRVTRGNFLRKPDYSTPGTGAQSYFVDPTGSDANTCTASGTSACLTIQGAINKIPKLLRDQVTVNIAAGTYAGFQITGFSVDNGAQTTTGGLLIDGALVTSTLATGSATGTAAGAGQSAGSGSTFGTLCDSGATWTSSDLIGRFITTALPTNATFPIVSNTATCVTIAGTWSLPVAAQTTYTIQDPSVLISTAATLPAVPLSAASANSAAIIIAGNYLEYRANAFVMRNMRLTNTSGDGIRVSDISLFNFTQMQIRSSAGTAIGVTVSGQAAGAIPVVTINKCDLFQSATSNYSVSLNSGKLNVTNSLLRSIGNAQLQVGTGSNTTTSGMGSITGNEMTGAVHGIYALNNVSTSLITGNRITCKNGAGAGIVLGSESTPQTSPGTLSTITTTAIVSTCGAGLRVNGTGAADVTSLTGAAATTGIEAMQGAYVVFTKAGVTITAGTNEVNIDSGGATAAFADIAAGSCLATAGFGSRVCAR